MKIRILLLFCLFSLNFVSAQNYWNKTQINNQAIDPARANVTVEQLFSVQLSSIKDYLLTAPDRFSGQKGIVLSIPNINGVIEKFTVFESSNFSPELQAQFPEIRSYVGIGLDDPTAYLRFSIAPNGIQSIILRGDTGSEFIEPYTLDKSVYAVYKTRNRSKGFMPFECKTADTEVISDMVMNKSTLANTQVYKTFRLALSCTGEYGQYHGGTVAGALAAMNATMTRVNGIYERDLSLHLNIIANNTAVIYTSATTDPYSALTNTDSNGNGFDDGMENWNTELQNNLTSVIGATNYDIGHLFGADGGGGNAGCIGCVCVDATKGSGITSPADGNPQGDTFDVDYVAHEMGHQLGANHTFSYATEGTGVNVEPGSGSTIMGYAGITNYNVQMNSDDYFAYRSILQIQTNLVNKTCAVNTTITNQLPVITLGTTITVPKGTPYVLAPTSVVDPENSSNLTYCWEQNNSASGTSQTGANSICFATKTGGPNFRSLDPKTTPQRYMPDFQSVLTGNLYGTWESLSTVARTQAFTLTVRDVNGSTQCVTQTATQNIAVSSSIGPFVATNPAINETLMSGQSYNLTWNVANTTNSPVSVANVKISLSTDGGATFTTLLASTTNDGSESVAIPSGSGTLNAYFKIEAIGNIFYTISNKFVIDYSVVTSCNTYTDNNPLDFFSGAGQDNYTSTINVPMTGVISDVNVFNNITHSYMSDVQTDISSPTSPTTYVKVFNRLCGNNNTTLNLKFSDGAGSISCTSSTLQTIAPGGSLATFNGQNPQGNWKIRVYDNFQDDDGTLNSWGIEICTQTITPLSAIDISTTKNTFELFPNPTRGNFTMQAYIEAGILTTNIYDITGKLVQTEKVNHIGGEFSQAIQTNLPAGFYMVNLKTPSGMVAKKLVIE